MAIKNHIRDRRPKPMIAAAGYTGRTRTYSKRNTGYLYKVLSIYFLLIVHQYFTNSIDNNQIIL